MIKENEEEKLVVHPTDNVDPKDVADVPTDTIDNIDPVDPDPTNDNNIMSFKEFFIKDTECQKAETQD